MQPPVCDDSLIIAFAVQYMHVAQKLSLIIINILFVYLLVKKKYNIVAIEHQPFYTPQLDPMNICTVIIILPPPSWRNTAYHRPFTHCVGLCQVINCAHLINLYADNVPYTLSLHDG